MPAIEASTEFKGAQPVIERIRDRLVQAAIEMRAEEDPSPGVSYEEIRAAVEADISELEQIQRTFDAHFSRGEVGFDKSLFHYILGQLGKLNSSHATTRCIELLSERPEETQFVLQYLADVVDFEDIVPSLQQFLASEHAFYEYQLYQIFKFLTRDDKSPGDDIVAQARTVAHDLNMPLYLRKMCIRLLGLHGSIADLEWIITQFDGSPDTVFRCGVVLAISRLEIGRRNALLARWTTMGFLLERACRHVRGLGAQMGCARYISWSFSRGVLFRQCPRKFFYQYYSYGEPYEEEVAILSGLTTLAAMSGQIVDRVITDALLNYRFSGLRPTELAKQGATAFATGLVEQVKAGDRISRRAGRLVRSTILHSHYYRYQLSSTSRHAFLLRVTDALDRFERSDLLQSILATPVNDWAHLRDLGQAPPTFFLFGLRVYAAYDFMFRERDRLIILDWKTGLPTPQAEAESRTQLAVYALYGGTQNAFEGLMPFAAPVWLGNRFELDLRGVSPREQLNAAGQIAADVAVVEQLVRRTVKEGHLVQCADIESMPASPEYRKCFYCNFRAICAEGQATIKMGQSSAPLERNSEIGGPQGIEEEAPDG